MTDAVAAAVAAIDTDRLVELVTQVCRIPSVLGDEGPLAEFLHDVMKESGFEATTLQPVLGNRPNAVGELAFGPGRRVVFTGHMDTKPVSHGWTPTTPFSGEVIDGNVYGHGIMDMKAALVCQIVAMEALRDGGVPLTGTLAMAAVSDHMGDQLGSIVAAVFDRTVALIRSAAGIELTEVAALAGPPPRDVFEAMWVTGRGLGFAELIRCHGDVMDPGQLQTLDEREILRQANAAFQRVLARI